jgi:hypothetical protein
MKLIEDSSEIFRFSGDHRFSIVRSIVPNVWYTLACIQMNFT